MIALLVKVKIKPQERERFLATIEHDAIASERDEPGCLRFNVLQDAADENVYYFYEVYRDEAALAAHQQMPHFAEWVKVRETALESVERTMTKVVFPREGDYWG